MNAPVSKSRLLPWIVIIGAISTLVALGCWQLKRLEWKETLMAQYDAAQLQPIQAIDAIKTDALANMAYHKVTFRGTFLHEKEVHLGGRQLYGKTGYELLTPMRLTDGRIFLVNRGWIPFELKDKNSRKDALPRGRNNYSGVIRLPQPANYFTPKNHAEKNFWFTIDIPAIEKFTGLTLQAVALEITSEKPDTSKFPVPSDGKRVFRNDHLGYAITWFALAISAAIMFWARFLRKQG